MLVFAELASDDTWDGAVDRKNVIDEHLNDLFFVLLELTVEDGHVIAFGNVSVLLLHECSFLRKDGVSNTLIDNFNVIYLRHVKTYLSNGGGHLIFKLFLELLDSDFSLTLNGGEFLSLVLEGSLDLLVDFLFGLEQSLHLVFHLFIFIINSPLLIYQY